MVVYRDGRTPLRIDVASVDSITFEDAVEEHEYVDLGLSVLWATCNIGAATPEEYGNYFAWGETATKDSYTEENYVYAEKGACLISTRWRNWQRTAHGHGLHKRR